MKIFPYLFDLALRLSVKREALALMLLCVSSAPAFAQQRPQLRAVEVDNRGVMRWGDDHTEVALFGVNYTAPFAHAFRALGHVGANRKAAIDMDVSHIARLGLDAYRIHVWDRQVSDREGNLLTNDHLDLLDYLISRLEERGIRIILTPIFAGGAGYPDPDPPTPGFSNNFSKGALTVDSTARRIQRRYFQQFVRHVNPYTKQSYSDDPNLIAIELFNEPDHPGKPEEQTQYINDLVAAVRDAGFRKPILYNVSQGWSIEHARAVCSAAIQGITFQWYPTGLVRGGDIRANMLPNVDRYPIPLKEVPACLNKARLVYEFDAADMMGSYMYPAMARSFREAGMQWATQFAYDPAEIAFANTEYPTHYLNLLYTPKKAISLMIAAEAFRRLPRFGFFGAYPYSAGFNDVCVSYFDDRSELHSRDKFYYSGDTRALPAHPELLWHIAGSGSSRIVSYGGAGAYFLDRLAAGVWRLEVYPDAVPVRDPFGRNAIDREVTRLVSREWPMRIVLPDLGPEFHVAAVDSGHVFSDSAADGAFVVRPGVYVLSLTEALGAAWRDPQKQIGNRKLGEFDLPKPRTGPPVAVHRPKLEINAGEPYIISANVVTQKIPTGVLLSWRYAGRDTFATVSMYRGRGYEWSASLPPESLRAGTLEYSIAIQQGDTTTRHDSPWRVSVVNRNDPIVLFDATRDPLRMLYPHPWQYVRFTTSFVAAATPGRQAFRFAVSSLEPDPHMFAMRTFMGDENRNRLVEAADFNTLRVRARSASGAADSMRVAIVERDGAVWGAVIAVGSEWREVSVPLTDLRKMPLALLPRPYPHFLPEEFVLETQADRSCVEVSQIEGVQIVIDDELYDLAARNREHSFEVERIQLVRER